VWRGKKRVKYGSIKAGESELLVEEFKWWIHTKLKEMQETNLYRIHRYVCVCIGQSKNLYIVESGVGDKLLCRHKVLVGRNQVQVEETESC
jgi:hypothetical protein